MTFIQKLMKKRLGNERGVTLIELLAVVVILGILAAVAVPLVMSSMDNAQTEATAASQAIILDAAERWYVADATPAERTAGTTIGALVLAGYLKDNAGYGGTVPVTFDALGRATSTWTTP